jgi:hypothetical protein
MEADINLYERVIDYFEGEFEVVKKQLELGLLDDYKERVLTSQKITYALSLLAPYVRSEWRARQLVKVGETLKHDLLSVRDIIGNRSWSSL